MKIAIVTLFVLSAFAAMPLRAQTPGVGIPVNLEIGIGGGLSQPTGTLSDAVNSGWHAGAKCRLSGLIPINLVASETYHRLPFKLGTESATAWMTSLGIEWSMPAPVVKPYLGADALVNVISSTAAGSTSRTREGLGIGAGAEVSLPFLGSIDASVKYQFLNLAGKEDPIDSDTQSQIAVTVMLVFGVL